MTARLPVLNARFRAPAHYAQAVTSEYSLLPFRFTRVADERCVLTNLAGEHLVVTREALERFVRKELSLDDAIYSELKARHFLLDAESDVALDLLAIKYRTKLSLLPDLTGLFMFVTTLRCEHSCPYCQVSRVSSDRRAFDMTEDIAVRAIDIMFQTPSPRIKVEFQGGEPLLNFELLRFIVERVEERNTIEHREVAFVIATNLALLTDEHLRYFHEHRIDVSTSLDGPAALHNRNRPRPGGDSHQRTIAGIERVRASLGDDRVSALMTTTEASLEHPGEVIDEYVRLGFRSIFLRSISPYGFAVRSGFANRYSVEKWLAFYWRGLDHILELNARGVDIREEYASLLLRRILSPFPTRYVDLQSPAGLGLSALVFNYDGGVYASDESRMLAEMGDHTFRLGDVFGSTFAGLISSEKLLNPVLESMLEGAPMCSDCAFLPFCGSDPVFHHATQNDPIGFKPTSAFCAKHLALFSGLIERLEQNTPASAVLRSWS